MSIYHRSKRQTIVEYHQDKIDMYNDLTPVIVVRKRQFLSTEETALTFEAYYKPLAYIFGTGVTQQEAIEDLYLEFTIAGENIDVLDGISIKRY